MIDNHLDTKIASTETFIETAQLLDSHRKPVAWMLAFQVGMLGIVAICLASHSLAATATLVALLIGILWYATSAWLFAFAVVVVGVQVIQDVDGQIAFFQDNCLLDCGLILLILIASFRYIELRSYNRTFGFNRTERGLEATDNRSRTKVVWTALRQLVRRQWYNSVLSLLAAFCLLWILPDSESLSKKFWLHPVAGQVIFLSLLLFFGWFICRTIISIWDWFGLTPRQADVAIRSFANREFWPETVGLEKRRNRLKTKDTD